MPAARRWRTRGEEARETKTPPVGAFFLGPLPQGNIHMFSN